MDTCHDLTHTSKQNEMGTLPFVSNRNYWTQRHSHIQLQKKGKQRKLICYST